MAVCAVEAHLLHVEAGFGVPGTCAGRYGKEFRHAPVEIEVLGEDKGLHLPVCRLDGLGLTGMLCRRVRRKPEFLQAEVEQNAVCA